MLRIVVIFGELILAKEVWLPIACTVVQVQPEVLIREADVRCLNEYGSEQDDIGFCVLMWELWTYEFIT